MKVTPMDLIKSISGKVCQHSDSYVSHNTSSGKMFTGKRCNPFKGEPTAKQIAQQEAFALRCAQLAAWLNANKPSETNGKKGTEAYQEAQRLKKQMTLSNVRQIVAKYMDASGVVTLPSGNKSHVVVDNKTNTDPEADNKPNTDTGNTPGGGNTSGSESNSGGSETGLD